jgi:hypothetical protein
MGPRYALIALAVAFGVAIAFATVTTVKHAQTSSMPHSTKRI